jgi:hypothetical protein
MASRYHAFEPTSMIQSQLASPCQLTVTIGCMSSGGRKWVGREPFSSTIIKVAWIHGP